MHNKNEIHKRLHVIIFKGTYFPRGWYAYCNCYCVGHQLMISSPPPSMGVQIPKIFLNISLSVDKKRDINKNHLTLTIVMINNIFSTDCTRSLFRISQPDNPSEQQTKYAERIDKKRIVKFLNIYNLYRQWSMTPVTFFHTFMA